MLPASSVEIRARASLWTRVAATNVHDVLAVLGQIMCTMWWRTTVYDLLSASI